MRTACLCVAFAVVPLAALAQSGSAGGSLGNDDKAVSGSRSEPRAPAPDRPAHRARAVPAQRSGGGGGNYDGSWTVVAIGNCPAAGIVTVMISGAQIIGPGISGAVTPGGAVRTVSSVSGMSVIGNGRIAGRAASGTYRQANGCTGTFSALKN